MKKTIIVTLLPLLALLLTGSNTEAGEKKRSREAFESEENLEKTDKKRRIGSFENPIEINEWENEDDEDEDENEASIRFSETLSAQIRLTNFEQTLNILKTRIMADHTLNWQGLLNIMDQQNQLFNSYDVPIIKRIVDINTKIFVKGDLHGDAQAIVRFKEELLKIHAITPDGFLTDKKIRIVFLGDYIDRGLDSIRTIELLTDLKNKNPQQVYLLRGNHEHLDTITSVEPGTLGSELLKIVQESGESQDRLNKIMLEFAKICSYLPQALFMGYQKGTRINYVAFLHGGIPTKTCPGLQGKHQIEGQKIIYETHIDEIKELLQDTSLINDSVVLNLQLPCHTELLKDETTGEITPITTCPFLWNDFALDPSMPTKLSTRESEDSKILAVGCADAIQWMKDLSSKQISVNLIIRAHQQSARLLFFNPAELGIWSTCNGRVKTLDFSPRVPVFFSAHYKAIDAARKHAVIPNISFPDTWLLVKPQPINYSFKTKPLNFFLKPNELPIASQKLTTSPSSATK